MRALYKGLVAGYKMKRKGGAVYGARLDKSEIAAIASKFRVMGFRLYATSGTAMEIRAGGMPVTVLNKISENPSDNPMTALDSGEISYIISTSAKGRNPAFDDVKIRRRAVSLGIPCLTSIDTANALADSLQSGYHEENISLIDINDDIKSIKADKAFNCYERTKYVFVTDVVSGTADNRRRLAVAQAARS